MRIKIAAIGIALLTIMLITTGTSAQGENLVTNGDFEFPVVVNAARWDIFPSGTPGLGWQVEWAAFYPEAPSVANLELHRLVASGWESYDGSQYAELDTDWDGPSGARIGEPASVRIYQDIATCPGGTYELRYAWSPRPGNPDNSMEVRWGTRIIAQHVAAGNSTTTWTLETQQLTALGNTTRLTFVETGTADALGMFLDAVQVRTISCKKVDVDIKIKIYPCCPDDGANKPSCEIECQDYISGAVLGSATFDVQQVNPASLSLGTLKVLLNEDGTPQCSIADVSDDGYDDLVCRFENTIQLTGELNDGTLIEGSDTICCY